MSTDDRSTAELLTELEGLLSELRTRLEAGERPPKDMTMGLLNSAQLCQAMGVSRPTLQRWVSRGCPRIQVGGSYRYRLADVLAWGASSRPDASGVSTDDGAR